MNKPKKYLKVESIHGGEVNLPIHRIQFTTPEGLIGFKRESGCRKSQKKQVTYTRKEKYKWQNQKSKKFTR